jgi:acid phosphatase type 7
MLAFNSTTQKIARVSSGQAAGNIDPPYGSYFPADNMIHSDAQLASQVGLPLLSQPGWGGGPNISLGAQPAGTLWGVHTTPYTGPGAVAGTTIRLSWHMGSANVGAPTEVGTLVSTASPAASVARNLQCTATVSLKKGASSSMTQTTVTPKCLRYLRVYTKAGVAGLSYQSPVICHALVGGLTSGTSYTYSLTVSCNNPVSGSKTYSVSPAYGSMPFAFNTPPAAGSQTAYPVRWGVIADVGQTYNSSLTAQYLKTYAASLGIGAPSGRTGLDVVLNVGDFTYSDNYGPTSNAAPSYWINAPGGTNQQRWDSWMSMWQPVLGASTWVSAAGNHEIENGGIDGMRLTPNDMPSSYGVNASDNYPFQSYSTRVPHGALPPAQWGDIYGNQYYSQNLGPVHVVVLNNYIPFHTASPQYAFFVADMAAMDRSVTPWLVVAFHASAYHTYVAHYKEMDCFLSIYEPLFMQYRVDFIFQGHVHAYERTHPVFQYERHTCGPVYVTIGDGGNIEGPYRNYVDDVVTGSNGITYCEAMWSQKMNGPPGYQSQVHPLGCPTLTYQSASGVTSGAGAMPSPTNSSLFYCQKSQPVWSGYRDPSFGFAGLTFLNDTTATYGWYRSANQRVSGASQNLRVTDAVTFTRWTGACMPLSNTSESATAPSDTASTPTSSSEATMPPPPPPPSSWISTVTSSSSGKLGIAFGVIFIVLVIIIGACLYMRNKRLATAAAKAGSSEPDGIHLLTRDASAPVAAAAQTAASHNAV